MFTRRLIFFLSFQVIHPFLATRGAGFAGLAAPLTSHPNPAISTSLCSVSGFSPFKKKQEKQFLHELLTRSHREQQ